MREGKKKNIKPRPKQRGKWKNRQKMDELRNVMWETPWFCLRFVSVYSNLLVLHVLLVPYSWYNKRTAIVHAKDIMLPTDTCCGGT